MLSLPRGHQESASWTNPLLPQLKGHGVRWGGVEVEGCPPGTELDTSLMSLCGRVGLVCWCGGHKRPDLTTGWLVDMWNSCTVPSAAKHSCHVRTSTRFVAVTHAYFCFTCTHTFYFVLTWPTLHCTGTWVTLVPGYRPDPWRQTDALCPQYSPGTWLCSAAQIQTRDCTRNLRWESKQEHVTCNRK